MEAFSLKKIKHRNWDTTSHDLLAEQKRLRLKGIKGLISFIKLISQDLFLFQTNATFSNIHRETKFIVTTKLYSLGLPQDSNPLGFMFS
jgi:hypothetical protein